MDGVSAVDDVVGVVIWEHFVHDEGVKRGFAEGSESVYVAANLIGRVLDDADCRLVEGGDGCGLECGFDLVVDAVLCDGLCAPVGVAPLVHGEGGRPGCAVSMMVRVWVM